MTLAQKKIKYGKRGLVYDPVTKRFRKSRKGKKAKFGGMDYDEEFEDDYDGEFGKLSMATKRSRCRARGLVYRPATNRCTKRMSRRIPISKRRMMCKEKGLVYDMYTRRCRKSRARPRKLVYYGPKKPVDWVPPPDVDPEVYYAPEPAPVDLIAQPEPIPTTIVDTTSEPLFLSQYGKVSLAKRRARCAAKNMRYNLKYKRCVPRKTSARKSRGRKKMTIAQKKALCRKTGKVYDPVTKRCRPRRNGKRGKFGMMYPGPADYRSSVSYLDKVGFDTPSLLLDPSMTPEQIANALDLADQQMVANAVN